MERIFDTQVSGNRQTASESRDFQDIFGMTSCTNNVIARSVELFSLAFVATAVYVFLEIPPVAQWFKRYIPNWGYRLFGKALLFFVLIYLFDRLLIELREEIDICDFVDDL